MNKNISQANVGFNYLKQSPDFLNLILNNISSCILLLDQNMELQAFNDAMTNIFSGKKDENLLYKRCGEAIGCAYSVDEMKMCGETSHCNYCSLRESVLISYFEKRPIYKQKLSREFYLQDGKKEKKHLQFSTRHFNFEKDTYIILIIDDISELINTQEALLEYKSRIRELDSEG